MLLTAGWEPVESFGFLATDLDQPARSVGWYSNQPVFVLRAPMVARGRNWAQALASGRASSGADVPFASAGLAPGDVGVGTGVLSARGAGQASSWAGTVSTTLQAVGQHWAATDAANAANAANGASGPALGQVPNVFMHASGASSRSPNDVMPRVFASPGLSHSWSLFPGDTMSSWTALRTAEVCQGPASGQPLFSVFDVDVSTPLSPGATVDVCQSTTNLVSLRSEALAGVAVPTDSVLCISITMELSQVPAAMMQADG